MIFISHNSKDKPIVEQLAVRLSDVYGQENVFYDSWSIQPGEGIIDKMNQGLQKCKFFFFFVSKNSLASKMVTMEWQNAIMLSAQDDVKLIPIRLDGSIMPAILTQTLFLDLFTNGLETTLKQAVDVIEGRNTYTRENSDFSNLVARVNPTTDKITIDIVAKHFMEPKSIFIIALSNNNNEANVHLRAPGMSQTGYHENVFDIPNTVCNGWYIGVSEATVPNFPFGIDIDKISSAELKLVGVFHAVGENQWQPLPIEYI
ncbi:toll/interleukin-1 receptor domain-containing protein [Carnobacterium sp. FSL E2-0243]|uniref:toll/interleukin-1 receptor domain-containing protein n=1 Tax=Carnobacterium sp. FSL E2-0243 TaxID=2921365 RepID=UPI0030F850ED